MLEMRWLESHIGDFEQAVHLVNKAHWFLNIKEIEGKWFVKGGESVLLATDDYDCVEAFIYGLSLAYANIPKKLFEQIVQETNDYL